MKDPKDLTLEDFYNYLTEIFESKVSSKDRKVIIYRTCLNNGWVSDFTTCDNPNCSSCVMMNNAVSEEIGKHVFDSDSVKYTTVYSTEEAIDFMLDQVSHKFDMGFLESELKKLFYLIKGFFPDFDEELFYKKLGVNTVMVIKGETVLYERDVRNALIKTLK